MNLVACPRCSAQMDVSAFQAGTKFQCGGCGNILEVPAAPAAPPVVKPVAKPVAQPVAKPVAKPVPKPAAPRPAAPAAPPAPPSPPPAMLQKKPAVDPRRAGGAAPAAPAAGRAERIRKQRGEGGEPAKKNPLPLVLAAVGGLVLVGGGIAFLMKGRGGDGEKESAKAPTPALGPGGGKKAEPPKEKTFEELPKSEQIALVDQKVKDAVKSATATKDSYEWLVAKGFREDAQKALRSGFSAFPTDPWITSTLGLRDRAEDIRAAANDDELTMELPEETPELKYLLGLSDRLKKDGKTGGWLKEDESKELDRSLGVLREMLQAAKDPVEARSRQEYTNIKGGGRFSGMDFAFKSYRPYVIFAEAPGPDRMARAEETVDRTGKAVQFIYNKWLSFMKDELKLDPPRLEDLKDDRLKIFVFKSRESFDAWHVRNRERAPEGSIAAYYEPGGDRMIIMHLDAFDPGTIMHEATHQIIHYYARWFCQKEDDEIAKKEGTPVEKVLWEDRRLHSCFFWFQEGIAEYFSGVRPVKGKEWQEWTIGEIQPSRIAQFSHYKAQGKLWPVEDFLYADQGQIVARSRVRGGGADWEELRGLMYAQGWTLVHYFLDGAGGRYRQGFLNLMRNEITGKSGQMYLLEAFGLPKRPSDPKVKEFLQQVEAGYLPYFDELFQRALRERGKRGE